MSGPVPGRSFAGYDVVRMLGKGGMGSVYLVHNPHLDRREALKVLALDADGSFAERFAAEARTVAKLDHPGIVTVYHHGITDSVPWFTMQYLDGADLSGQLLPHGDVTTIVAQAGAALDYAHARNVVHRDIKPANLMVRRSSRGTVERITVLDFGIARLTGSTSLTGVDSFIGTLTYSAPESITGDRDNPASDQYALACTAYELLTGRPPFAGLPAAALLNAQLSTPAPPIGSIAGQYAHLNPVFARALAKDPAQRYRSCRAFAEALADSRSGSTTPPTRVGPVLPRTASSVPFPAPVPASSPSAVPASGTANHPGRSTMTLVLSALTILIGLGVIGAVAVLAAQSSQEAAAPTGPDASAAPAGAVSGTEAGADATAADGLTWGLVVSPQGRVLKFARHPDESAMLTAAAGYGFTAGSWGHAAFTAGCAAVAHATAGGSDTAYYIAHAADRETAASDAVTKSTQGTGRPSQTVDTLCVGDAFE